MTTIGYATLQVIPTIVGLTGEIDKQLGGLKTEGRAAGKALGDGLAAGVGAAAQKVEQASKKVEAARNKEADAAGKLRTAEAQLETLREKGIQDAGRLTAAEEKIKKAKRDHDTASGNLTRSMKAEETATERLTAAQKRLADSSDEAGDSVDGMFSKMNSAGSAAGSAGSGAASSFMEGMTGGLAALGTRTGPIGAGIMAAAGLGLGAGALLAQNIMAGLEREVSQDRVQAQLGMSEGEAARFGQSTGKVYADNFGESLEDVGTTMADVASTFPNVTGTALEDLTAKALTFRDVFGLEVPESVAAAQNLIVNGLATDGSQAFDLLTASFQRVPAAMREELPEILNEYATNFQSLGYSGEEAFGMLVAAAPRGAIVLDKIGDSLKEFTLLATDLGSTPVQEALMGLGFDGAAVANNILAGGDTAQQQFQQIVDGLLAIPDAGEQAAAAVTLFGTPLEDLDKSKIPQFLSSLDEAGVAMDGFAGSAQSMVDTVGDNTGSAIETAARSWETAVSNMQVGLAEAFGPQLEEWAKWFTDHGPQITEFFAGVGEAAVNAGEFILFFVAETIGGMADLVNEFGDVLGGMATVGAEVFDFLGQGDRANEMRDFAEESFGMADGLYEAEKGARAASEAMGDAADKFGKTQEQAKRVGENVDRIAGLMAALPNGKEIDISAIVTYKDQNGLVIPPDQLRGFNPTEFSTAGDAQQARRGGFDLGGYTGNIPIKDIAGVVHGDEYVVKSTSRRRIENDYPGLLDYVNATGLLPGYQAGGRVGAEGLNPGADYLRKLVMQMWPEITRIGGHRGEDGYGEHSSGNAIDIMIPNYASPEGEALGDSVLAFLQENSKALDLNGVIWRQASYGYGGSIESGKPMSNRGNDTQNHYDHLHVILGEGRGEGATPVQIPVSALSGIGSADIGSPVSAALSFGGATPDYTGLSGDARKTQFDSDNERAKEEYDAQLAALKDQYGMGASTEELSNRARDIAKRKRDLASQYRADKAAAAGNAGRLSQLKAEYDKATDELQTESDRLADDRDAAADAKDANEPLYEAAKKALDAEFERNNEARKKAYEGSGGSSGGGSGSGFSLPSAFSDFGSAIGEFAGGQIGSALDVFGIPDSPGWLQGISQFVGGISVSDANGNSIFDGGNLFGGGGGSSLESMLPISASPSGATALPELETAHGLRAGQAPGPGVVYNITARDTEDAFIRAQRKEKERAASKLERF